jgi:NodT family efflux transporter outer membrane factor (OMF) lipoprotein
MRGGGSAMERGKRRGLGRFRTWGCLGLLALILPGHGCTSLREYVHNGFKVGPNYGRPPAPLAPAWIDAANPRVKSVPADYSAWWAVFDDPVLDDLVKTAYEQNIDLRVAGMRVLEARAQRAIAAGNLFPQQQTASGSYDRFQLSANLANPFPDRFFDNWATGLNASWEIDFWGRFRRQIESKGDLVQVSVEDYDNVLVSLIGDVATAYVQYRIFQQQIVYTRDNIESQKGQVKIAETRWKGGLTNERPVIQAKSLLAQNESLIPVFEIALRQANNQLCVLLGIPPSALADKLATAPILKAPAEAVVGIAAKLGTALIPKAPAEVVVGIPADLIRRRPDLRSAERQIAAQNAQIGVAETDWYPAFFINGTIGYAAQDLGQLFATKSFTGAIGPSFQWNILNYGRILNNVRFQDFKTQELVAVYQQKVLAAAQEVENGIVTYLRSRQQAGDLAVSVQQARQALRLAIADFRGGATDYTSIFVAQQFLTQQENDLALAEGNIALGLISTYRALGGGWELRLTNQGGQSQQASPVEPLETEVLPGPRLLPPAPNP